MRTGKVRFTIRRENVPAALEALHTMAKGAAGNMRPWLGINSYELDAADDFRTAIEAGMEGWTVGMTALGDVVDISCKNRYEMVDDEQVFAFLAPHVEAGSFIEVCPFGNPDYWWCFSDGKLYHLPDVGPGADLYPEHLVLPLAEAFHE